jgi:hypothetical protein
MHAPANDKRPKPLPPDLQPRRMISLPQAAELRGISVDTFKRNYKHLIVRVSPRRLAVRLGDVVNDPQAAA